MSIPSTPGGLFCSEILGGSTSHVMVSGLVCVQLIYFFLKEKCPFSLYSLDPDQTLFYGTLYKYKGFDKIGRVLLGCTLLEFATVLFSLSRMFHSTQ